MRIYYTIPVRNVKGVLRIYYTIPVRNVKTILPHAGGASVPAPPLQTAPGRDSGTETGHGIRRLST